MFQQRLQSAGHLHTAIRYDDKLRTRRGHHLHGHRLPALEVHQVDGAGHAQQPLPRGVETRRNRRPFAQPEQHDAARPGRGFPGDIPGDPSDIPGDMTRGLPGDLPRHIPRRDIPPCNLPRRILTQTDHAGEQGSGECLAGGVGAHGGGHAANLGANTGDAELLGHQQHIDAQARELRDRLRRPRIVLTEHEGGLQGQQTLGGNIAHVADLRQFFGRLGIVRSAIDGHDAMLLAQGVEDFYQRAAGHRHARCVGGPLTAVQHARGGIGRGEHAGQSQHTGAAQGAPAPRRGGRRRRARAAQPACRSGAARNAARFSAAWRSGA